MGEETRCSDCKSFRSWSFCNETGGEAKFNRLHGLCGPEAIQFRPNLRLRIRARFAKGGDSE